MWNLLGMQVMEIHLQELLHLAATERLVREGSVPSGDSCTGRGAGGCWDLVSSWWCWASGCNGLAPHWL